LIVDVELRALFRCQALAMSLLAPKEAHFWGHTISSGNILITEDDAFDGGLLIGWGLCTAKDGERKKATIRSPARYEVLY
jgi:hypothetical protein